MRRIQLSVLALLFTFQIARAQKLGGDATIKSLAVAGPVVGTQATFGRVDLAAPATQRVVIAFVSSEPHIGLAPADVIIGAGQTMQTFVVKTEAVASPTLVTLTARALGSPVAKATFTVIPPSLTILDCEPKSLSGGSHATCKAWMDGVVANGATPQLALSSSNAQVAHPAQANVTVPSGSRWVTFDAIAGDLPQSASAMISATYAGVTKSSSLSVTPAAIKSFGCFTIFGTLPENPSGSEGCHTTGGDFTSDGYHQHVGFVVRLTAPAPHSGYKIGLSFTLGVPPDSSGDTPPANPFDWSIPKTLEVPAEKDHGTFPFHTSPVESAIVIKVSAKDPITGNSYATALTVYPPRIHVTLHPGSLSAVPLGGQDVDVLVEFKTDPPPHGIAYDVTYGGTTDIKGPARVRINPGDYSRQDHFKVKVSPCALNPPCHVSVTLGGGTGTATVNH